MGLRSRFGDTLVRVGKTFGTSVPASFTEGEAASQMTPASPFSPGTPIGPYDGYDRQTRQFNFTTGYNISTRPRLHEAVSFSTLTGLVESYDVCQIVIWHRIDSIRSLDYKLVAADHYFGDITDAIPLGLAALRKPDRKNSFKSWLAKYLYDILAWDAGTLYRLRNRGGRCIGLMPTDGRTLAPLLDYWGNSPDEPAEAYVQYVNGLPWNWLTRADIIYEPFRPVTGSPYGRPPIESVILNANTDLRFQVYFLQRFTEGNLPAAFAASPDSWSPDQIEQFQGYWDAMMYGDQARKHQIRWMPGGSKIAWSNEKEFSDLFSLYLLRKTCAAFHVVPSDLGFTESVNRSSGESQADVQHRVGDLPLMEHVEGILSAFLLDDLGLPLKFEFDRGEEQVDQLAQAEADQKYMDRGVVGASEIREMRYGLTDAVPVPRVFFTERAGPIPISSLEAVAGEVDPQTSAPEPGAELPREVFEEAPGVQPNPPLYGPPLAEEIYGPSAIPADTETASTRPVAKEGDGAPTAGITAESGVYSYDLERDDEDEPSEAAVAKEMAAFRRFERARLKSGAWRDFEFRAVDPVCGHHLNGAGRQAVQKADPKALRAPALDVNNLTGVWAVIYGRRNKLLAKHTKAVAAAWDACIAELGSPASVVREFRSDAVPVAKLADPNAKRWQDLGTAAALAWLTRLAKTKGYPALVAAIEDAIRSGMAEGEAGALALAADRQGKAGFQVGRAFRAAYDRLAGDAKVTRQAQDAASGMVDGAAGDVGGTLADQAGQDGSEADMTLAVDDTVSGGQSRSVELGTDWALYAAILGGAVAFYQWVADGGQPDGAPPEGGPEQPPVTPPAPTPILLSWITAGDSRVCPTCSGYEDNSPYAPEAVPDYPHPRCRCSVDLAPDSGSSSFLGALLDSFAN